MNVRAIAFAVAVGFVAPAARASTGSARIGAGLDDDYPAALALARDRKVPIVVDVWAPW